MTLASEHPHDRLLFDLVSTPSVSGDEADAAGVFVFHGEQLGLCAHIDVVGNAIAEAGDPEASRTIVLLGHIDTVPGEIPVRAEDGVLHGRGAVDAKGPLAAMLAAAAGAAEHREIAPGVRVLVVGAVGEETTESPGARALARSIRPDACIIGEPSGWDGVTLGYKGRLVARAEVSRSSAHTAGPEESAGDRLLRWWASVRAVVDGMNQDRGGEAMFDQIQASVRAMAGEDDGLRESASLLVGFRLPEWTSPAELEVLLREFGDGIDLEARGHERAHVTDRNDAVVRALTSAIRAEGGRARPKRKTGTSDLNVVAPVWNCPIAAYGSGDSSLDHTPDERLDLAEYHRSVRVLRRAIATLSDEISRSRDASAAGVCS
ncbi:MAG: [LysW]-lysine hydrolase [Planctomycetota bacterium]